MKIEKMTAYTITVELTRDDIEHLEAICESAEQGDLIDRINVDAYRVLFQLAFHAIRAVDHGMIDGETLVAMHDGRPLADVEAEIEERYRRHCEGNDGPDIPKAFRD